MNETTPENDARPESTGHTPDRWAVGITSTRNTDSADYYQLELDLGLVETARTGNPESPDDCPLDVDPADERARQLTDTRTEDNEVSNDGDLFHEFEDPTL